MATSSAAPESRPTHSELEDQAPPSKPQIWYNAWGEASKPLSLIELSHLVRNNSSSGVVMIEGIDERIFSLVSEAFRTKELYYFLYQHAARVEDPENSSVRGHTKLEVGTSEPLIRKLETSLERRRFCGLHFDGFHCPVAVTSDANSVGGLDANASVSGGLTFANDDDYSLIPKDETRIETFVSDGFAWYRTSTRISCCQLASDLYLVLVDPPLSTPPVNVKDVFNGSFPVLPRNPKSRPHLAGEQASNAYKTFQRLSTNFSLRGVLISLCQQPIRGSHEDSIFHCLITVSEWQSITEQLERDLRRLRSQATKSIEETTLDELSRYRRILADTRESIADNLSQLELLTRKTVLEDISRQSIKLVININLGKLGLYDKP